MAEEKPEIGDRVLYRGVYREVIGWQDGPGEPVTEDRGEILVYQNPATERNTYTNESDMEFSEHFGAFYPVGLLLSRAECVVYAALPDLPGGDVPQARQHERAARMLEDEELTLGALSEEDRETLEKKIAGYWPDESERPGADEVFSEARRLRDHREQEG